MGHSKKRKRNEKSSSETETTNKSTETTNEPTETEATNEPTATEATNEPTESLQTEDKVGGKSGINRRARIIIRNLSFKSTEKKLKKHFEQYGEVLEVKLLKRPDGKLVGCGFIQYKVVQNAAKAIYNSSGKPFLGRDIVCDWALGKDTYVKNMKEAFDKEVKEKKSEEEDVKAKEKILIDDDEEDDDKKNVVDADKTLTVEDSSEEESDDEKEDEIDSIKDEDDMDSVEDEDDVDSVKDEEPEAKRPKVISNDVQEGKTVFIKNVPFRATNEDIKECLSQFGPLYYALVCVDQMTEHSKGTAFVKFRNQEDAEKCLEAGTELTLMGNILDCHRAVNKNELGNKNFKKEEKKDSRNLYLIKEGVILAGTKAAEGVSASDMAKRLDLEKWKTQMLRNLNMFISWQRLIIHNLPLSYDDKKLRQLVAKYAGPKAVIKEARVMRDMRNLDEKGVGTSKELGFVAFAEHEDALKVLRILNNNPDIFSKTKRPIVAFSIENKAVINARNKRLIKSKQNNPTSKEYDPNAKKNGAEKETNNEEEKKGSNRKRKWEKPRKNQDGEISNNKEGANNKKKKWQKSAENEAQENQFTGVTAKPGAVNKMRSKFKLRTQAQLHHENLKKEKNKQKTKKKSLQERKQDFIRQPSQKQGKGKKDKDDNFSKLVNKYKSNLLSNSTVQKNKWYET